MSVYIGRSPTYGVFAKQTLTPAGSASFTLDYDVPSQNALIVVDNGEIKNPGVDFTAIGTALTFATPPTIGHTVYVIFLGTSIVQPTLSPGYTTLVDQFTGDGTTEDFTLSEIPATDSSILVVVDGIIQRLSSNWTLSGDTLTFTSAPDSSAEIEVIFLTKARIAADTPTPGSVTSAVLSSSIRQSVFTTQEKTANFQAAAGYTYFVNTGSTTVTATLPASATMGDVVRFIDAAGTFATRNLTVSRNGHRIQGATENLTVSNNGAGFALMYYNSTYGWRLMEN
jgi:hypothetical protein